MKSNTQLRQESIKKVLNVIRANGPLSKRELQEITGFSWGNISSITSELLNVRFISASGKIETVVGRRPELFDIVENDNLIIGIDFSTKGVLAVLCDLRGRVIFKTEKQFYKREKNNSLETLYISIAEILEKTKKNILYIAIAMQGDVDSENGISINIKKIAGWRNVPVCQLIEEKFSIKTVMFHDPDCILHTEKYYGALSDSTINNAILLSMTHHGIGIASLLGGEIYMGNGGKTCEIGAMLVPSGENNNPQLLQDLFSNDWINEQIDNNIEESVLDIANKARNGNIKAIKVFEYLGEALGVALNNTGYLLNPQKIILFGSFCRYSDLFLERTKTRLCELMGEDTPEVVLSKFDDTAAAIGATLFAADLFVKDFEI